MRALVTGGGGFVGTKLVEFLLQKGDAVRVLSRRLRANADRIGATVITGDIRDPDTVQAAMDGVDVVYHLAAKTGTWGSRAEFFSINVTGTSNVIDAAKRGGVRKIVYTSSPSVVGYATDVENGGPNLPYATRHESFYAESKAEAERMVLSANSDRLATVALRPHLIIGPGDTVTLPRVLDKASRGLLRIIGDGRNRVDLTYVDNVAWAHLDAEAALTGHLAPCAGCAYFISNSEPVVLWDWLNQLLQDLRMPETEKRLSLPVARFAAGVMEAAWRILPLKGEPYLTRFLASALARSHWYDMGPAARDLGYRVRVPLEEAKRRIVASIIENVRS